MGLGGDGQNEPLGVGDRRQTREPRDLLIDRGARLGRRHHQDRDGQRLGQPTDRLEASVERPIIEVGSEVEIEHHRREARSLAEPLQGPVRITRHLRGLQMSPRLVDGQLDSAELQVADLTQARLERMIREA